MITRYGPRVSVTGSANLTGDRTSGTGRVLDLSLPGCLLEYPNALRGGDYVQLRLFLPDRAAPMSIPLAVVRWVKGTLAGLEFIRSSKGDQARLAEFVQNHMPSRDLSQK